MDVKSKVWRVQSGRQFLILREGTLTWGTSDDPDIYEMQGEVKFGVVIGILHRNFPERDYMFTYTLK